jgi:hypothetical protein
MTMKKLCVTLCVMGVIGVASLGFAPLETLIPQRSGFAVPRFALLIQPMLLTLAATGLGCWAAPKMGLGAPLLHAVLSRSPAGGLVLRSSIPALLGGIIVALTLIGYSAATQSVFGDASGPALVRRAMDFEPPLISKLLYGGVAEELIARWGVMSGVALAALKIGLGRTRALWTGNLIAALLFGLGHLPLLFALMPSPPLWLIGAVICGNVIPGLIFGLLFWRRGIESAMIGHATGHFLATLIAAA